MVRSLRLALGLMVGWGLVEMLGGGEGAIASPASVLRPSKSGAVALQGDSQVLSDDASYKIPKSCKFSPPEPSDKAKLTTIKLYRDKDKEKSNLDRLEITFKASSRLSFPRELPADTKEKLFKQFEDILNEERNSGATSPRRIELIQELKDTVSLILIDNGYINSNLEENGAEEYQPKSTPEKTGSVIFVVNEGWVGNISPIESYEFMDHKIPIRHPDFPGYNIEINIQSGDGLSWKQAISESMKKELLDIFKSSLEKRIQNEKDGLKEEFRLVDKLREVTVDISGIQEFKDIKNSKPILRIEGRNAYVTFSYSQEKLTPLIGRPGNFFGKEPKLSNFELANYICQRIRPGIQAPLNINDVENQLRLLREDSIFDGVEGVLRKPSIKKEGENNAENDTSSNEALQSLEQCAYKRDETLSRSMQESCLVVKIIRSRQWSAAFFIDNNSPPSVGSVRIGGDLRFNNLMTFGDELGLSGYSSTTGGNQSFDLTYRVPLNSMNDTLQLRVSPLTRSRVTQSDLRFLDIRGNSELYEISYRHNLLRTLRNEMALSLGFTRQSGKIFISDRSLSEFLADDDKPTQTSVFKIGLEQLRRAEKAALFWKLQMNIGTGLFGVSEENGFISDGHFVSLVGQLQWLQRLGPDYVLVTQLEGQLTPDRLPSSQQFVLGGAQSLRGYRQNSRLGDNGFRFSMENRITLWDRTKAKIWKDKVGCEPPGIQAARQGYLRLGTDSGNQNSQNIKVESAERDISLVPDCDFPEDTTWTLVAPFFDAGMVWNDPSNPNALTKNRFLSGIGIGLMMEKRPRRGDSDRGLWRFRIDYGMPLVSDATSGDDLQDSSLYFSLQYRF